MSDRPFHGEKNAECEKYFLAIKEAMDGKKKNCNRSSYSSPARTLERVWECKKSEAKFTFYSNLHYYRDCVWIGPRK